MPPPINGQSLCFKVLVDHIQPSVVIDRNVDQFNSRKKAEKFVQAYFASLYQLLFGRVTSVYISVSRSWPGSLFDGTVILISKLLGKTVTLHLHGNDFLRSTAKRRLFSRIYSIADNFIALSEPMKSYLQSVVKCPVTVVINPIQNYFFESRKAKADDSVIRVVYLSNIMFSKGIFDFLQMAALNQGTTRPYEFHIIGKFFGDERMNASLVQQQFNSELSKLSNTTYHGSLYGQDLSMVLSEMNVLVFPSFYPVEALPLSVLEAASQGLYIVVNDHNDLSVFKTLLPHVYVTDTKKTQDLLSHLHSIGKEQITKMGENNREVSVQYSVQSHVDQVKSLLK